MGPARCKGGKLGARIKTLIIDNAREQEEIQGHTIRELCALWQVSETTSRRYMRRLIELGKAEAVGEAKRYTDRGNPYWSTVFRVDQDLLE